jgi:hypothetical protein
MPKFKTIIRLKDEDSATSKSFTETVDAHNKETARDIAWDGANSLLDVYPYAKISVSVKEIPHV